METMGTTTPAADHPTVELDDALDRLRRFGGDQLLRDMIDLFLEHAPVRIAAARLAVANADPRPAQLALHSLVSSCAQLGAERLRTIGARAEQLAGTPAALPPLLDALDHELTAVTPLLVAARPPDDPVP